MRFTRRLFALFTLFLSLGLFTPHDLSAQETSSESPIIALVDNDIYAVSPSDGAARLLVGRSGGAEAGLKEIGIYDHVALSAISPDNTKFAYTAPVYELADPAFEDQRADMIRMNLKEITLVDIASGEQTLITDQGANFAEAVEHDQLTVFYGLTWSPDSQRLYFIASVPSMRNRVTQSRIEYYDLESGERHVLARIPPQIWNTRLYGVNEGLIAVNSPDNDTPVQVILYGLDGSILNTMPMPVRAPVNHSDDINPILKQNAYYFGYHPVGTTGSSPAILDAATGEIYLLDEGQYPAFMSHTHLQTSLRLALAPTDLRKNWVVTDPEGSPIPSMTESIIGLYYPSAMALSPDGQSIAFFDYSLGGSFSGSFSDPAPILVVDATGVRKLNFKAHEMMWGAVDFTFAPVMFSE